MVRAMVEMVTVAVAVPFAARATELGETAQMDAIGAPPQDSEIVDLVAGLTGDRQCIKVGFGSEGGLFSQQLKIPTVVCGPGSIDQAHKPDEYLTTDQLSRCDCMMDALLEQLA